MDDTIRLWDVRTGREKVTLTEHTKAISKVVFSLDGKLLASGHYKDVQLWDAVTGQHKATFTGHAYWVNGIAFSPDPHGTLLATGDEAGAVLLWGSVPSPTTNAVVSVSPASVQLPAIGEQLTVAIKIAGGENVSRYQATVGFDPSALRYVSSANGDYLPSGASFARATGPQGEPCDAGINRTHVADISHTREGGQRGWYACHPHL
jgi:WD40 repeat protein